MLGIALGAFTQGFNQGLDTAAKFADIRDKGQLRAGIKQASTEGQAAYEADVAAGTAKPNDPNAALAYIIPKVANTYMVNGQPEVAAQWADWMETNNAKRGTKLFMSGLSKLQGGDVQAGIDDMTQAANLQGYGPDGKVTAAEYYDEAAGAVTGYRFTFQGADGETHTKNVATDDVASFMAGLVNPQSAFELDQASKAARSKADLDVETHGRKKQIEAQLGVGTGALTPAQYQNAIQEERKALEDRSLTDKDLQDLSSDEKEALAKETVDKRFGKSGGAAAGPTVTVDPETGEQVDPAATETPATDAAQPPPAEPTDAELGVDEMPTSSVAPQQAAGPAPAAPGVTAPAATPAADTTAPTDQKQQYLTEASQLLKQGGNAQQIGQALVKAGIPPEQWPQDLQLAARSAQLGLQR